MSNKPKDFQERRQNKADWKRWMKETDKELQECRERDMWNDILMPSMLRQVTGG